MKFLITIWILLSLSVFAQTDCNDFKVLFKEVDNNYSELSQNAFPSYIKFTLIKNDTLKTSLYNVKGELKYQKNFGFIEKGTYLLKIFNSECTGVYFISTEIGNQTAFKKAIQIISEASPTKELEIDETATIIDGLWKRNYSEKFIPAMQPEFNTQKIEYHYRYDLQINFSKGSYKIISKRTDLNNGGKEIKTFEGKFCINGDTLKLYEESKLKKVYQYSIVEDTLSFSYHSTKDEKTGAIILPMETNIYNTEIKLIGKYHQ